MIKAAFLCWLLIFALAFSGCSGDARQLPMATSTLQLDPEPDPVPDPVPDPEGDHPTVIPTNSARIPVTWQNINLTGKLVYNMGAVDEENKYIVRIHALDLVTGDITVLYQAPLDAWIYYVSVSPDGKHVVMSYSPPLQTDPDVVQAIYIMPLDGSEPPELLFMPKIREDQYIQAEWSPDGKYIYYTHVIYRIPADPNRIHPLYKIYRMAYPGGQPELIAEEAYWPRLSPDSSRLIYVSADPFSAQHQLILADADGGNAREVIMSGSDIPDIMDAPIFSSDGGTIIFSGAVPPQAYQPNWFEKLLGVRVAKAHDGGDLSDWWSVPVNGGELARLTNTRLAGLYADISPDNKHIVSFSRDEIFVMNPDGSKVTVLFSGLNRFYGTVNWIP